MAKLHPASRLWRLFCQASIGLETISGALPKLQPLGNALDVPPSETGGSSRKLGLLEPGEQLWPKSPDHLPRTRWVPKTPPVLQGTARGCTCLLPVSNPLYTKVSELQGPGASAFDFLFFIFY